MSVAEGSAFQVLSWVLITDPVNEFAVRADRPDAYHSQASACIDPLEAGLAPQQRDQPEAAIHPLEWKARLAYRSSAGTTPRKGRARRTVFS